MKVANPILGIPTGLIPIVTKNKLVKQFRLLCFLKMASSGRIGADKQTEIFATAREFLKIRDSRTWDSYMKVLLKRNWIGYDKNIDKYYIYSFRDICRAENDYSYKAVSLSFADLKTLKEFLYSAIIGKNILDQKAAIIYKRKKNNLLNPLGKRGRKIRHVAENSETKRQLYFGLSNKRSGELISVSPAMISKVKKQAKKLGYMEINHKFNQLCTVKKISPRQFSKLKANHTNPFRIRLIKTSDGNLQIVEQLMDETTCKLHFIKNRHKNFSFAGQLSNFFFSR